MVLETWQTAVGLVGIVIGLVVGAYEWWGMPRLRRRVIVTFRDPAAPSLDGILWQRRGRWLVLREVSVIDGVKVPPTRLDGEVTIDRDAVLFLQVSYAPPGKG